MGKNIRAEERPLFPLNPSKFVTNFAKRCWHTDINQRPTFSSIYKILRYTKRFIWMNPDYNKDLDPLVPTLDYTELEPKLSKKFPAWDVLDPSQVAEILFQIFEFGVVEKERTPTTMKETLESSSEVSRTEISVSTSDDLVSPSTCRKSSTSGEFPITERKSFMSAEFSHPESSMSVQRRRGYFN